VVVANHRQAQHILLIKKVYIKIKSAIAPRSTMRKRVKKGFPWVVRVRKYTPKSATVSFSKQLAPFTHLDPLCH